MTYTGMELFMENLKMVVYGNDNPVINSHPSLLSKRPEILMLYEVLSSMIQTLFVEKENDLHELEEVTSLKNRFKVLAEEAHIIIALFVYTANFESKYPPSEYSLFKYSLNLVMRSHDSIKKDFVKILDNLKMDSPLKTQLVSAAGISRTKNPDTALIRYTLVEDQTLSSISHDVEDTLNLFDIMRSLVSIKVEFIIILANMDICSSPKTALLKTQSGAATRTSRTRNIFKSKAVCHEIIVGLDDDARLIRDKLVDDQKKLNVVSIVGMGGIGKTTLATKLYNDGYIKHHFHVRAWATVSQTYEKQDLLIQILASIGVEIDPDQRDSYSCGLREKLHKCLMGKRYLIVIDDIWSKEAWDDLKPYFPNGNTGSRILLTSRLKEVASHGFLHRLECLTDEESWELLCKKVFQGFDCPEWLIESGLLIAKNCRGLPLALVVISGVLAKEALTKDSWENVAHSVSSYIVNDRNGFVDMLALSYDHLPPHLKDCFLYLGAFPEDHKFRVRKLIWLWMAEGFIQDVGTQSSEEVGEEYLRELVDRNLVNVIDRSSNGAIKACSVHDLIREFCLKKAAQEDFCMKINMHIRCLASMRLRRIFTNVDFFTNCFNQRSPRVRTLLCLHNARSMINITDKHFSSYPLLMVLDIQNCKLYDFPKAIELLVHLRYLAFWYSKGFPSYLCNLWSLQTIITKSVTAIWLPNTVSNLVNLRHLKSDKDIFFDSTERPMNLQTISTVKLGNGAGSWVKNIPAIKTLKAMTRAEDDQDFESLTSLETLVWINIGLKGRLFDELEYPKIQMRLPTSLRKLSITGCYLSWSDMSILQSLPNLEVLKILDNAFMGPRWETGEPVFPQLKYLKLQGLDIQYWEASTFNFPCLKRLVLDRCKYLEEIPVELGDIPTLELIDVDDYNYSVIESLDRILEEQQDLGNYDLKIKIRKRWTPNFNSWRSKELSFVDGCIKTK